MESRVPAILRTTLLLGVAALALAAALSLVPGASASHFRGGDLHWSDQGNLTVRFDGTMSVRASSLQSPAVGSVVTTSMALELDDYSSLPVSIRLTSVDPNLDQVTGSLVDGAGNPIVHTYPAANKTVGSTTGPYTASISSCCRSGSSPYGHVNNVDSSLRLETTIDLSATNSAPAIASPPVQDCRSGAMCRFTLAATDPDGDAMTYRFSLASEAGDSSFQQPGTAHFALYDAAIGPSNGTFYWDTTGAQDNVGGCPAFWSFQVMTEDGRTKSPYDAVVRLGRAPNHAAPSGVSTTFVPVQARVPTGGVPATPSVPPAVPAVPGTPGPQRVHVHWATPDMACYLRGFAVERQDAGGPWHTVATVAGNAVEVEDLLTTCGHFEYRIVATGNDGVASPASAAASYDVDPAVCGQACNPLTGTCLSPTACVASSATGTSSQLLAAGNCGAPQTCLGGKLTVKAAGLKMVVKPGLGVVAVSPAGGSGVKVEDSTHVKGSCASQPVSW